jgi:hypothetical protein
MVPQYLIYLRYWTLQTEDKIDDIKDRLYKELEQVFDKFPK